MTIEQFIEDLQKLPNKHRQVTIVVGTEDNNSIDTPNFEIHHQECLEHPIELFVLEM